MGGVIAWNWRSDVVLPPPPASYSPGQVLSPLWALDSGFAYLVTVNLSVSEQLLTSSPIFTVFVGGSSQTAAQQVAVLTGNDPVVSSVSGVISSTASAPETVLHFSVSDGLPAGCPRLRQQHLRHACLRLHRQCWIRSQSESEGGTAAVSPDCCFIRRRW